MATFTAILVPSSPTASSLFNGTAGASATVTPGFKTIIGIACISATAGDALNVRFGSALKAPTATVADWPVAAGTVQYFDLGSEFDRVAIFSATTPKYYVYVFSKC
jgi:hypothetical protein